MHASTLCHVSEFRAVCGLAAVTFHLSIMGLEAVLIVRANAAPGHSWLWWTIVSPTIGALNPHATDPVRDAVDQIEDVLKEVIAHAHPDCSAQGNESSSPEKTVKGPWWAAG